MKNNKKLVVLAGAAALGLVAATGVTSGFAWFAVNSTVTATSLTVQAKSNAAYLKINNVADTTNGATTISAAAANPSDTVYPVSKAASQISWNSITIDEGDWYTATVNKRDAAVPNAQAGVEYTSLEEVTYGTDDYFVHYDFYLYLDTGSKDLTGQTIRVTASIMDNQTPTPAASTVVKAGVKPTGGNVSVLGNGDYADFSGLALKVPSQTSDYLHFEIELFIEGTAASVMSATSLADLAGTASFTFALQNA